MSHRALAGYRRLFRARRILFEGDERALRESRLQLRAEFQKNRQVPEGPHLEGLFTMIDEAEDMMLHGIVRGELNPQSGNYEVKLKAEHATAPGQQDSAANMEPITPETAARMTQPPKVEVTQSKNSDKSGGNNPT